MQHDNKIRFGSHQWYFKKIFFLNLIAVTFSSEFLIVESNFSKIVASSLIADIKSGILASSSIGIISYDYSLLKEEISTRTNLLAVFDITDNLNSQFEISKLCEDNFVAHFLASKNLVYHNKWTFSLSSSKESLNEAIIATLRYFNWTDGVAVSSVENYSNSQIILNNYSKKIKLFSAGSDTFIQDFVGKEIMKLGSSLFYLMTDKNTSIEIQQALVSSKILINETGIVFVGESSYGSTCKGALAIVEKGKEAVDSYEKYLSAAISDMILFLKDVLSSEDLPTVIYKRCPNYHCANEFSIINIQAKRKIIGVIKNGNLTVSSTIIFPGNSTVIPVSQKKILYISANDGTTNPGAPPNQSILVYKRGLTLGVKHINSSVDMLQNFQLKLNDFDCGVSVYNATFFYNCLNKDKNKLGLAHIFAIGTPTAYGEIATLAKLNITIPCVGALNVDPGLSNFTKYPFYTRVSLPSSVTFAQIPLILKALGWNSAAILYQNDSLGINANTYISQAAEKQNLIIVNELKTIPALLNREQLRNYTNVFENIIDTHARIVILVLNPPLIDYTAELFYDLGMRKGDIIFLSTYPSWLTTVANKDDYTYKRVEVAIPLITVFQSLFVGEVGKKVHDELYKTYGNTEPTSFSCQYYDAVYLIATALDWTIDQGKDYTDPYVLEAAIRDVKFTGCSGKIYIQKNSNDVLSTNFTIQSNSYNATAETTKVFNVGFLTPTSSQVLTIASPVVYADGSTNKPTDFRITRTNCPFDDKLKQTFSKGRALVFGICFFIAVVTAIITFLIWKKWWNIKVEELIKSEEISVEDMIVGATIVVEFFQLLSQGPDIRPLNSFLADIGDALSLDLTSFIKLENGVFWMFVTTIIVLCGLWSIFCIEIFLQLDEKFNKIWIFRVLGVAADYSMPILGNLCFIPFISILLEIFVCDHSIGNNFADSYLSIDCYQFCWQGDHITYATLSTLSLVFYEPFAVFCRPLWQEFQSNLHVKSIPLYLMIKTVIQVMLIVLNKTLKRSSDIAHGFIFTFIILFYLAFVWRFKAYNYGRFNWWLKLSLIGVSWVSCLSTIIFLVEESSFPWVSLIIAGWAILILIGFAVQKKKYPSLLFRKKGKDTSTLFKFAFTFGKHSKVPTSKIEPQKLDLSSFK
ncbi:unnamed protein product [Blepharisma stoltei]|uniref:Receptor ligand binding region domain-containing protein n=1 Tax=Blepharisma stoltei TaxID=1481888 RepID=A0AAU9JUI9_9CILI|nr:unnamed protein product [Blepharisma stoltei]